MKKSEENKELINNSQVLTTQNGTQEDLDVLLPKQDFKKIVVYIFGKENIEYVSGMTHEQKNVLINNILEASRTKTFYQMKQDAVRKFAIQLFIIALMLGLALPILHFVSKQVFNYTQQATKDNYSEYGKNFEKLYKDRKVPLRREHRR